MFLQHAEQRTQLLAHQQAQFAPVVRILVEQPEQGGLGHLQERCRPFGEGVMGACLAVEQADLAEPVGRLDQAEQGLLAIRADHANAHRTFDYAIQATGRVATTEQALPGLQAAHHGELAQGTAQAGGQRAKPAASGNPRDEGNCLGHGFVNQLTEWESRNCHHASTFRENNNENPRRSSRPVRRLRP
ncbi:hypothetical protein D3C80_1600030 [compost metagenome]